MINNHLTSFFSVLDTPIRICWSLSVYIAAFPAASTPSINSDLVIHFSCVESLMSKERQMENFLNERGFEARNMTDHSINSRKNSLLKTEIVGVDKSDRQITIKTLPFEPQQNYATLLSRPPTEHAADLETAMINFFGPEIGCKITSVERYNNEEQQIPLFDYLTKLTRSLFDHQSK